MGGWIGSWVCPWVGGEVVVFFPPLYRPRAGIVQRTARFTIITFKVNNSQQEPSSCQAVSLTLFPPTQML